MGWCRIPWEWALGVFEERMHMISLRSGTLGSWVRGLVVGGMLLFACVSLGHAGDGAQDDAGEVTAASGDAGTVVTGLLPEPIENDEAALLEAAKAVEPEVLEDGIRRYVISAGRVATWEGVVDLEMRLFLPAEAVDGPYPLVAYIHGGGFIGGSPGLNPHADRGWGKPLKALIDDGFAVASLRYRLAREAGWPAMIQDTLCGLRFLVKHGGHWGIDASRVGVSGHSAGARGAALLGMLPQDGFHVGDLPWQGVEVPVSAVWMWAGATDTAPRVSEWEDFAKARDFSVPRLHFGEHPAFDDQARHRLRLRNNYPHFSNALPPLFMLRGDRDYRGDHSDAERTIRLWRALGSTADLLIVPGGHGASGPPEPMVEFFRTHLRASPFSKPEHDALRTADVLLGEDEPAMALEVLNAAHTTHGGQTPPPGDWMILHDQTMVWVPTMEGWDTEARALGERAKARLSAMEIEAAETALARGEWFRVVEAAENAGRLAGESDETLVGKIAEARAGAKREAEVFTALSEANALWHEGETDAAKARLREVGEDARVAEVLTRLDLIGMPTPPSWASAMGRDVYGFWADVPLGHGVAIRMRWVEPGAWEIPEPYRFRNRETDPWTERVEVEEGFWLAETPVTNKQWRTLGAEEPVEIDPERADLPRVRVDYLQIVDWLARLSATDEGLVARLPREAEWLHAATLGGRTDTMGGVDIHAVHVMRLAADSLEARPVKGVVPTLGGLYGMLGGVQEWTASPGMNASRFNDETGRFRVIAYPIARGGSWASMPHVLDYGVRMEQRHANRIPDLGFRIAVGGADAADWLSDVEHR